MDAQNERESALWTEWGPQKSFGGAWLSLFTPADADAILAHMRNDIDDFDDDLLREAIRRQPPGLRLHDAAKCLHDIRPLIAATGDQCVLDALETLIAEAAALSPQAVPRP